MYANSNVMHYISFKLLRAKLLSIIIFINCNKQKSLRSVVKRVSPLNLFLMRFRHQFAKSCVSERYFPFNSDLEQNVSFILLHYIQSNFCFIKSRKKLIVWPLKCFELSYQLQGINSLCVDIYWLVLLIFQTCSSFSLTDARLAISKYLERKKLQFFPPFNKSSYWTL